MKNIRELQGIVDSLAEWNILMANLAICPYPYTRMDKYWLETASPKVERAIKLLQKEISEGEQMARAYQKRAYQLRDPKMNQEAIASCIILNGIVHQANECINRFNAYLVLCNAHI